MIFLLWSSLTSPLCEGWTFCGHLPLGCPFLCPTQEQRPLFCIPCPFPSCPSVPHPVTLQRRCSVSACGRSNQTTPTRLPIPGQLLKPMSKVGHLPRYTSQATEIINNYPLVTKTEIQVVYFFNCRCSNVLRLKTFIINFEITCQEGLVKNRLKDLKGAL